MRWCSVLFLALLAAHGPSGHLHHSYHPMLSNWHMGPRDGSSPRDFNRTLGHIRRESIFAEHRLDRLEIGNGAKVGVGFVSGRHMGFKFKMPF